MLLTMLTHYGFMGDLHVDIDVYYHLVPSAEFEDEDANYTKFDGDDQEVGEILACAKLTN